MLRIVRPAEAFEARTIRQGRLLTSVIPALQCPRPCRPHGDAHNGPGPGGGRSRRPGHGEPRALRLKFFTTSTFRSGRNFGLDLKPSSAGHGLASPCGLSPVTIRGAGPPRAASDGFRAVEGLIGSDAEEVLW